MSKKISNIKNPKIKNLLRGLLDKEAPKSLISTHNRLRQAVSDSDVGLVENILFENELYSHLSLPEEFPKDPTSVDKYIRLSARNWRLELLALGARLKRNEEKLKLAILDVKRINGLLLQLSYDEALEKISTFVQNYGHSNLILRKLAYINSLKKLSPENTKKLEELLNEAGVLRRNYISLGLIDLMDDQTEYLKTKKALLAIKNKNDKNTYTKDIVQSYFHPIEVMPEQFSSKLQTWRHSSLIDSFLFVALHFLNVKIYFSKLDLNSIVPQALQDVWHQMANVTAENIETYFLKNSGADGDFEFYRRTIAFIEISAITKYRCIVDTVYINQDEKKSPQYFYFFPLTREYFASASSINGLQVETPSFESQIKRYDNAGAGLFSRTLAFLYLLERNNGEESVETNSFMKLMSQTTDIPVLASASSLKNLRRLNNSDFMKFVIGCLLVKKSQNDFETFTLRRVLQALISNMYNGSIIDFINDVHGVSPAIAIYFVELADEAFLSQLFNLIDEAHKVYEIRAEMYDWMAEETGETVYADRAKTLRVDLKLQQVRGEIDDTRIYVDAVRFIDWMHENIATDLSAALKFGAFDYNRISAFANDMDFSVYNGPEAIMARIFRDSYREFCENSRFGIASYLGRRIRHGTLKGVMISPVEDLMNKSTYSSLFEDFGFNRYFHNWFRAYSDAIDILVKDNLQINNTKKSTGLIDTNVFQKSRTNILKRAIKDIETSHASSSGITHILGILHMYCWLLLDVDLVRIREKILSLHQNSGRMVFGEVAKAVKTEHHFLLQKFVRELTVLLEETFRTVSSWFKQPTNLSPSAPLDLLFDAVLSEVKGAFPDFIPKICDAGTQEIVLKGGTYHLVYDALYIVMHNAGRHGRRNGKLVKYFNLVTDRKNPMELLISVTNELPHDVNDKAAERSIQNAVSTDTSNALVEEGNSGLRKLARLASDDGEITEYNIEVRNKEVIVSCFFKLAA
jgi:hypothetical protein